MHGGKAEIGGTAGDGEAAKHFGARGGFPATTSGNPVAIGFNTKAVQGDGGAHTITGTPWGVWRSS